MCARTKIFDVSGDEFVHALAKYLHQKHIIPHPRKDSAFVEYFYFNAATMLLNYYHRPSIPIIPRIVSPRGSSSYNQEKENYLMVQTSLQLLTKSGWIETHHSGIILVTEVAKEQMKSVATQLQASTSSQ